jgi:hypothetical protein
MNDIANSKLPSGTYWTSGSDAGCPGKHAWCTAAKMFRNVTWSPNIYDIEDKTKMCVTMSLNNSEVALSKAQCSLKMKFVCEVPFDFDIRLVSSENKNKFKQVQDTSTSMNGGKAMMNECAEQFQINSSL